ncbi:MAG TPA: nucleotidyltransferase domain-containing protein [Bacteroidota bacterium]|nr:nucleotidyltransferase domain-containing protein [Bacteroidota bacterium]
MRFKKEEINKKLTNLFSSKAEIILAYLFGSTAEGKAHKFSDVDVAVYYKTNPSFKRHLQLINDICSILETDDVDVVNMNTASPLIIHDILSFGELLICRDDNLYVNLRTRTLREFDDLVHILRIQGKYIFGEAING